MVAAAALLATLCTVRCMRCAPSRMPCNILPFLQYEWEDEPSRSVGRFAHLVGCGGFATVVQRFVQGGLEVAPTQHPLYIVSYGTMDSCAKTYCDALATGGIVP